MIKINNVNKFLRGCSDHRDQLLCLFELKKSFPGLTDGVSSGKDVFDVDLWHVVSSVVRRGQEMFHCGCGRFRFVVRVIHGMAVFIKSVF